MSKRYKFEDLYSGVLHVRLPGSDEVMSIQDAFKKVGDEFARKNVILVHVRYHGQDVQFDEWERLTGADQYTIMRRLQAGWSYFSAVNTPGKGWRASKDPLNPGKDAYGHELHPGPHAKKFNYDGRKLTLAEWSVATGISEATLRSRRKAGWSTERMLTTPLRTVTDVQTRQQMRDDLSAYDGRIIALEGCVKELSSRVEELERELASLKARKGPAEGDEGPETCR